MTSQIILYLIDNIVFEELGIVLRISGCAEPKGSAEGKFVSGLVSTRYEREVRRPGLILRGLQVAGL